MAQDTWDTAEAKNLILTDIQELTTLLRKPVKDQRRIKFTCFDVSTNYIALGSTTGSIYLFTRSTCLFRQLIPLSYGAVSRVLISPDEKLIALSTNDAMVCLMNFKPHPKDVITSSARERDGKRVTALCWNDNSSQLYIGDVNGTVYVMGISMFTVKRGIFQDLAYPIMELNHEIIQMDFCMPFLLVSTASNCYICDTDKGQYEQVGIRTRQGKFGACFYKTNSDETEVSNSPPTCLPGNAVIKDIENHLNDKSCLKIYCARPGSRLWEAKTNGQIIKTHNFKQALGIPPSPVCKSHDTDEILQVKYSQATSPEQSLKFSLLYVIDNIYLFTYNSTALYILDPINSSVVLWCNDFADIFIARVTKNLIYLMTNSGDFYCITLLSTNSEISNTMNQVKMNTSFDRLKSGIVVVNSQNGKLTRSSGNVTVSRDEGKAIIAASTDDSLDNQITLEYDSRVNSYEESLEDVITYDKNYQMYLLQTDTKIVVEQKTAACPVVGHPNLLTDEPNELTGDIELIYTLTNTIKTTEVEKVDEVVETLRKHINQIKELYENSVERRDCVLKEIQSAEQYYENVLLSRVKPRDLVECKSIVLLEECVNAFLTVNTSGHVECKCDLSYSRATKLEEPIFFDTGKELLQIFSSKQTDICLNICTKVPYMWRVYLPIYNRLGLELDKKIIAQCLQTKDSFILAFIVLSLNEHQWVLLDKYFNNTQREQCLFCDRFVEETMNSNNQINWDDVVAEMIKLAGSDVTTEVIQRIVTIFPSLNLNRSTFRSMIISKILNKRGLYKFINFDRKLDGIACDEFDTLCSIKIQKLLTVALEKDLTVAVNEEIFKNQAHHWGIRYKPADSTCPCCTLPLQTPILLETNGLTIFSCGHSYHGSCLIQKRNLKCNLHP